jgi:hypothetical protein
VRLQIPCKYLDAYINLIREWVPMVPTELTFNINENDFSDWEEHKSKFVVIPTEARVVTLHCPENRQIRH